MKAALWPQVAAASVPGPAIAVDSTADDHEASSFASIVMVVFSNREIGQFAFAAAARC